MRLLKNVKKMLPASMIYLIINATAPSHHNISTNKIPDSLEIYQGFYLLKCYFIF